MLIIKYDFEGLGGNSAEGLRQGGLPELHEPKSRKDNGESFQVIHFSSRGPPGLIWNSIQQSYATLIWFGWNRHATIEAILLAPSASMSLRPTDWKPIIRSIAFRFQLAEELCGACTTSAPHTTKQSWSGAPGEAFLM